MTTGLLAMHSNSDTLATHVKSTPVVSSKAVITSSSTALRLSSQGSARRML